MSDLDINSIPQENSTQESIENLSEKTKIKKSRKKESIIISNDAPTIIENVINKPKKKKAQFLKIKPNLKRFF